MDDIYYTRPEELARLYAEQMAKGFGPNFARKLGWIIRDARAAGDRRRVRFWERVRDEASANPASRA